MSIDLFVSNSKTKLKKTINADGYSLVEVEKTFNVYLNAGYNIHMKRGLR